MVEKKLKELYPVDNLSQDKGWKKIIDALASLEEDISGGIRIDFTGINVIDPWTSPHFQQLIRMGNVHFKFTNNEELVNHMKMLFIMDNLDVNRITSEIHELPRELTSEEKKIIMYGKELLRLFKIEDDTAILYLKDKYGQVYNSITVDYVKYAVDHINAEQGIKNFIIDFESVPTNNSVLEVFATEATNYSKKGINIMFNITDEENLKNMKLFRHKISNASYTPKVRLAFMKKFVAEHKNAPGMLIKYKKSRALDEFGRQGKGEAIMCRVAILRDIVNDTLRFETYNNNTFYTHQHWLSTHDNVPLDKLHTDIMEVKIDELGFGNKFLGAKYHFNEAVQKTLAESVRVITGVNENGSNISEVCTIPERMKKVFDDWGIEYNEEMMERAIESTKRHLESED